MKNDPRKRAWEPLREPGAFSAVECGGNHLGTTFAGKCGNQCVCSRHTHGNHNPCRWLP